MYNLVTYGWVEARLVPTNKPVWINLLRVNSMLVMNPGSEQPFTRLWSGDQGAVNVMPTEHNKAQALPVPFCQDVYDTPEQLFMAGFGCVPGREKSN